MHVGFGAFELHLPYVRDLKAKRRIVKSLVDRLHARHRVSVAETGHHDLLQRAQIGVAVVASTSSDVERILTALEELVAQEVEAVVLDWRPEILGEET